MSAAAIVVERPGPPEVLELRSVPVADPGPGQVRVAIEAIGVNFVDIVERRTGGAREFPFVPGYEACGTVEAAGPGTSLAVGTRVAMAMAPGAYAQLAVVAEERLVVVPEEIPAATAAAVMMQGMTAHALASSSAPVGPGSRVLVLAAGGGVGQLLVQIARLRGAEVVAVAAGEEKLEAARAAGASEAVPYTEFLAPDSPLRRSFDVVFDGVGADTYDASLASLAPRGTLALFGAVSGPVEPIAPRSLGTNGSVHLTWFAMTDFTAPGELRQRADELFGWLRDGRLQVRVVDTLPLAEAARAHALIESRQVAGKLILRPGAAR